MREAEKQYQLCKDACENMGCYCPKECEFHQKVANTNAWIRAYFFHVGFETCKEEFADHESKDDNNVKEVVE